MLWITALVSGLDSMNLVKNAEIFIQTQTQSTKIHSTDFVPCEIYNRKSFVLSQSLSHFSDQPRKTGLDPPSHMETTLEDSSEDMETITGGQFRGNGDHHWRTVQRILDNFLIFY